MLPPPRTKCAARKLPEELECRPLRSDAIEPQPCTLAHYNQKLIYTVLYCIVQFQFTVTSGERDETKTRGGWGSIKIRVYKSTGYGRTAGCRPVDSLYSRILHPAPYCTTPDTTGRREKKPASAKPNGTTTSATALEATRNITTRIRALHLIYLRRCSAYSNPVLVYRVY